MGLVSPWPITDDALVALQHRLADDATRARHERPWRPGTDDLVGGCFVAYARGEAGPGHPGDRAWAAAVTWRASREPASRRADDHLRGQPIGARARQADDVESQHVVVDRVPASYAPGLLARREGPVLAAAVDGLPSPPDVLLVDATGRDHPRHAGLALHLGAATDLPTVGVTHRGLTVRGDPPHLERRGDWTAVADADGDAIAAWVCTRSGARALLVHAAWRTDVPVAVDVVLSASTPAARTPVPLQEARRVGREARAIAYEP